MAGLSEQEISELFAEFSVAHLCTVRPDGRPHVAPVSYMVEGDKAYVATPETTVKLQNVLKNPKVSLSIANEPSPAKYVVLEGDARVAKDEAARVLEHVSIRNYGPEAGPAVAEGMAGGRRGDGNRNSGKQGVVVEIGRQPAEARVSAVPSGVDLHSNCSPSSPAATEESSLSGTPLRRCRRRSWLFLPPVQSASMSSSTERAVGEGARLMGIVGAPLELLNADDVTVPYTPGVFLEAEEDVAVEEVAGNGAVFESEAACVHFRVFPIVEVDSVQGSGAPTTARAQWSQPGAWDGAQTPH